MAAPKPKAAGPADSEMQRQSILGHELGSHWANPEKTGRGVIECPLCGSTDTEQISDHGVCSCRSYHRCRLCGEPFDHVKAR